MPIPPISAKKMSDFRSISKKVGTSIKRTLQKKKTRDKKKKNGYPILSSQFVSVFLSKNERALFSLSV